MKNEFAVALLFLLGVPAAILIGIILWGVGINPFVVAFVIAGMVMGLRLD